VAHRYNYGDKFVRGPDYDNPIIDWQFPDITPWTKATVKFLIQDFFFLYEAGKFNTIRKSVLNTGDVERSFHICLLMMKSMYRRGKFAMNLRV
jgi:hypothetical protein